MGNGARNSARLPPRWRYRLLALLWGAAILATGAILVRVSEGRFNYNAFLESMQHLGPAPLYAALAVLPLLGAPATPILAIAGAAYPLWFNIGAAAISLAVQLTLAYLLASQFMRGSVLRLLDKMELRMPPGTRTDHLKITVLVKLTPGPPAFIKNYGLAATGIRFDVFLGVTWTVSMAYALGTFFVVYSAIEGVWSLFLFVVAAFVVSALFARWLWMRVTARKRAGGAYGQR